MSQYKCINPYYSQYMTKRIGYGDLISSDKYYILPLTERQYWQSVYEEPSNSSTWVDNYPSSNSDLLDNLLDSSSSWDFGSSSDSSSSDSGFDFGGGDTGGGGASGDW